MCQNFVSSEDKPRKLHEYLEVVSPPSMEQLQEWMMDGCCEAVDGCLVEPDGTCPHGYPSWFLVLGLI
jgi:hypothetical protein